MESTGLQRYWISILQLFLAGGDHARALAKDLEVLGYKESYEEVADLIHKMPKFDKQIKDSDGDPEVGVFFSELRKNFPDTKKRLADRLGKMSDFLNSHNDK